jgi:hypothetical protein
MLLRDGTVVPAHMNVSRTGSASGMATAFNNTALRVGYITAIHYPGEEGYVNNRDILYDAIVLQGDGTRPDVFVRYKNCRLANFLGYSKDWEKRTLRCPTSHTGVYDEAFLKSTTRVLLLCANGRANSPYIIAADSAADSPPDRKEDGHMWGWEFNGVNWLIDKDGQLTITHKGPTAGPDGKDLEPDAAVAGTFIKFDKDGSFVIDDVKGESITIDKKNKKIIINSREMEQNATSAGWTVEAAKDVKIHAGGNVILNGDNKTYIGKEGASEPLVLGNKLAQALNELVTILSSPVIGALGQAPVTINPGLAVALKQWQAKYATPSAPILSKKKFTE